MMANFKIYPLCLGRTIRNDIEAPVVAFYLTDGVNRVMVDTGGVPADGVAKMPYYQEPGERIEEKLEAMGIDPATINIVIISHLHWDHMSNNHLFPNAKFYLQRSEYHYAMDPVPPQAWGFDKEAIIKTKWELLDGEEQIIDGISVVHVGGHTPGSQCVIVDTEKGKAALTCDFVTDYSWWESDPKIASNVYTDIIQYYRGFKMLEKACDYIIPGHSYEVLKHEVFPD